MKRYQRNPKASAVIYARVPIETKKKVVAYARRRDIALATAITELLELGVAEKAEAVA